MGRFWTFVNTWVWWRVLTGVLTGVLIFAFAASEWEILIVTFACCALALGAWTFWRVRRL
jgi:hypothetical protein